MNELLKKYKKLSSWEKMILIWYVISMTLIVFEYLINLRLESDIYFHPYIIFMINLFLIIDVFFIPMILIIKEIVGESGKTIVKVVQIFLASIGLSIMALIVFFIFVLTNKSVINSYTVDVIQQGNKIYIEETVWLESNTHMNVYQVENVIFIRRIGSI